MKKIIILFILVLNVLSLLTVANCLTFTIDPESEPLGVVSDKFLSVALDCSNIDGRFSTFNLTDPNLTKLVKHLSPMYFRIGGTYADKIVFSENEEYNSNIKASDLTFYASDWLKLYQFTKNADVRLIYDLNSLQRNEDGTWNSENAEKMIKFSQENGIETDWELGNEPDLYQALYNTNVGASQLGTDFKTLRAILNKYELYNSSYLVGPDMFDVGSSSGSKNYLSNFLKSGSEAIYAVTWHQYYFAGKSATKAMFLNPATFNYLEQRANVVKSIVNDLGLTNKIWMGETSSAYQGGAPNMSDRFLASFLWIDKLGLGAKLGMDVIIRQAIFHDNYSLLDETYTPNPDWWLSILYKKVVGTKVLSLESDGNETETTRLYAHCAKSSSQWGDSAVVVFGSNIDEAYTKFSLNQLEYDDEVYVYVLSAPTYYALDSKSVRLNGEILTVGSDNELPPLEAYTIAKSDAYIMPPYTIMFWVFPNANVNACKSV